MSSHNFFSSSSMGSRALSVAWGAGVHLVWSLGALCPVASTKYILPSLKLLEIHMHRIPRMEHAAPEDSWAIRIAAQCILSWTASIHNTYLPIASQQEGVIAIVSRTNFLIIHRLFMDSEPAKRTRSLVLSRCTLSNHYLAQMRRTYPVNSRWLQLPDHYKIQNTLKHNF